MAMKANIFLVGLAVVLLAAPGFAQERNPQPGGTPTGGVAGPNDTCDGAILLQGAFDFPTDTCDDNDDYNPGAGNPCTGFSASGPDETYTLCLPPGGTVDLIFEELQYDASIYLVTDCADVTGSCVAGDDCFPDPCTDFITYTNLGITSVNYWLIIDGFGGECGLGQLTGVTDVCGVTPVEPATWGSIKSDYR